jgi:Cu2+-exporting ATPase
MLLTTPINQSFNVLHKIPGRCRLRFPNLREDKLLQFKLEKKMKSTGLIDDFRFKLGCNSVIIMFQGSIESLFLKLMEPDARDLKLAKRTPSFFEAKSPIWNQDPVHSFSLSFAALMLGGLGGPFLSLSMVVISGLPIWRRALLTLIDERRLNVDFLDALALTIAVLRRQPQTAALLTLLVHLGDVVRERTAKQSHGCTKQLMDLHTLKARRIEPDGTITTVVAETLQPAERVLLLAGDLVPADGRVIEGIAAVDQRHITGESNPATRRIGDIVFAGSSLIEGSVTIAVTEAGANTLISQIVEQVESAPVGETKIQNYAERFADHLVAPMLAPTSILTSMIRASKEGILIKSGSHVEKLAGLKGIAFDKTGTLTRGRLEVLEIKTFSKNISCDRVLLLAAAAETKLRHPVARALVSYACKTRGLNLPECENVDFVIGMGVAAECEGQQINIGSDRYLRKLNISTTKAQSYLAEIEQVGHIALLVALDGELIGAIACSDEPRPEAKSVIQGLLSRGVKEIVMLSGDRAGVARRIAQFVGIKKVYSEVLPHEKAEIIRELRNASGNFAMVGDGVNDSPALAQADIGISLFDGADIARSAADVVLMKEGLHLLLPAIDISRNALSLVKQNYSLIAGLNTIALALALPTGLITPATCTLISNGSTLLATMNAMRPLVQKMQYA